MIQTQGFIFRNTGVYTGIV